MHPRSCLRAWLCRSVAAFLLLAAAGPSYAQSSAGSVEGRVQNTVTGDFLNNARVAVKGSPAAVFTDLDGRFRLNAVPAGAATLQVTYTGLDPQEQTVQVSAGGVARHDFGLTSKSRYGGGETVVLDAFSVAATREMNAAALAINEQRYAPNIKNVIAADAFGDVSEGNVGEFIKRLPGVTINEAAGDAYSITLRGFAPEFTPITVDGNTVPSASFSATSVSRGSNLEQVSMSNVSRLEVIKSPIPSISADSLGGSVNLISKSAFERSKPELTVRGTLQFTSDDYSWDKTPGPGSPETRKLRPGYEFSYVNPVSKNFGFTLSSLLSDQFGRLLGPIRTFEYVPAQGGSIAAPYLRALRTTDDARETMRQSFAGSVDWRPVEPLTLSASVRHTLYDLFTAPQRIAFNTGNLPASYGPDFTVGRTGAGSIAHQQIWTTKYGNTDQFTFSGKYRQGGWRGDFSTSYADSGNKYRDMGKGFFRGATTRLISPTVSYDGFGSEPGFPGNVAVRNATGTPIDWTRLQNYQLVNVLSVQRDASDEITSGAVNLRRELMLRGNPGAIQVGASYRKREVDRGATDETRTFLGADGIALTADDAAAPFIDSSYAGVDQKFGVPKDIQWPDLRALYQLYRERPGYFSFPVAAQATSYIFEVSNSERIAEEISAAYVQGELSLWQGRLALIGGVRMERTENTGVGLLRDRDAVYQRNAAGNIVRAANGTPVFITNDPLERAKLEYLRRGLTASHSYHDYYPSVNATYTVLPDLLLRLSYARTLRRDSKTGKFAMWYMSRPPPPLTGTRNLYAVSDDGLRWSKPALGVYADNGSTQNNMLGVGGGSLAVLHDSMDPDPNRRYKRFAHRSGGYFAAYSADGIHWTEEGGRPVLTAGDTITLAQNPTTGEYLAFHKRPHRRGAFDVRVVWLARSRDFKTWTEPRLVLAADDADQDWATQPDERTEIYDMAVFPHAAGYLGFPAVFRNKPQTVTPELRAAGAVAADGPLDIQLATSEDGDTWRRTWPRLAVIPRGAPGTFDGGAILGVACAPVHTATETWVYYSAISATHGASVPPKTMTIGRAEWRRHGFVSADAGPQGGEIETKPLRFGTPSLVCNADARVGEVRLALLEVDGRAIPGRGFAECAPLNADQTRWVVKWAGKEEVPTDRPVRVAVQMRNARLFSLEAGEAAR